MILRERNREYPERTQKNVVYSICTSTWLHEIEVLVYEHAQWVLGMLGPQTILHASRNADLLIQVSTHLYEARNQRNRIQDHGVTDIR